MPYSHHRSRVDPDPAGAPLVTGDGKGPTRCRFNTMMDRWRVPILIVRLMCYVLDEPGELFWWGENGHQGIG